MPPLIVVGGPRRVVDLRVTAAVAAARAEGWTIVEGWAAPMRRDRIVCTGWVRTVDDARRALLAAVAGAGLIVAASADAETLDRMVDDLRRLGPVDHLAMARGDPGRLAPGQRTLLALLAEGLTVHEAATSLGIDRRAAGRRLAAARRVLGVESNAAAIAVLVAGPP
jgi:DNA-binding CsgD family transcriptional regulator